MATPRKLRRYTLQLGFLSLMIPLVGLQAQEDSPTTLPDPFGLEGFGSGPYEEMSALLEVTIFNIDVLTLTVRVGPEDGAKLKRLIEAAEGREYSDELADSVAMVILDANQAWARQVFKRDVSLDRLAGGMRETTEKAAEAGYVSEAFAEQFGEDIPVLFDFLEEDGAKEGDAIYFLTQGDEVRTVYQTARGDVLSDRSTTNVESRRASIPSFFAPDTRFRKRLVESLLESGS